MKIIDLLNKMANGENVPDKIRYRNCIFEKTEGQGISPDYVNNENTFFLEYVSNETDSLNEIVELIEDEEIDIQNIEELDTHTFDSNIRTITIQNRNKINEIIKMFNQVIKRTRKEKE